MLSMTTACNNWQDESLGPGTTCSADLKRLRSSLASCSVNLLVFCEIEKATSQTGRCRVGAYSFEQIEDAFRKMQSGRMSGKVVFKPNPNDAVPGSGTSFS